MKSTGNLSGKESNVSCPITWTVAKTPAFIFSAQWCRNSNKPRVSTRYGYGSFVNKVDDYSHSIVAGGLLLTS